MCYNKPCRPVNVLEVSMCQWNRDKVLSLKIAELWARYAPRGKGAIPRFIGRVFGKSVHCSISTKHGARLAVVPSSLDTYAAILSKGGAWNEHVFKVCANCLARDGVFYDIGANVGYMSIEVARIFDGDISVIAIEPQPDLSRVVALSARLNDFHRVKVFGVMLGACEGRGRLFVGTHQIHASAVAREKGSKSIDCRVTTIDTMVERGEIPPPTVLKLDIEGGELRALQGATTTLRTYRPAIIFECDENATRFGYKRRDIIDYLSSIARYTFHSIVEDGTLVPLGATAGSTLRLSDDVLARPG
jgi:FkbM family methyltransferase